MSPRLTLTIGNTPNSVIQVCKQGPAGRDGTGGDSLQEAEADQGCLAGQPLYLKANGHISLAQADNPLKAQVCGLCTQNTASGFSAVYQINDVLELADWSAIVGASNLNPGTLYFLSLVPGQLVALPPLTGFIVPVGQALTTQRLRIAIDIPLQL